MSGVCPLLIFVAVWLLLMAWKAAGEGKPSAWYGDVGDDAQSGSGCSDGDGGGCH